MAGYGIATSLTLFAMTEGFRMRGGFTLSLPSPIKGRVSFRQAQDERDGQDLGRGRVRDCCVADRVEKMGYNPENTRLLS